MRSWMRVDLLELVHAGGLHSVVDAGRRTCVRARWAGCGIVDVDVVIVMHARRGAWGRGYGSKHMGLSTRMDAYGVVHAAGATWGRARRLVPVVGAGAMLSCK